MALVNTSIPQPAVQSLAGGNDPTGGWLSLLGGLGALGGGLAQAGAQNNSASLAQQYAAMASQLGGFGLGTGPGGVGATGNPLGAGGNLNFGNFNPAYQGLAGLTGGNVGTASGIGAPAGLNSALGGAFGTAAGGLAGFNPAAPGFAGNADLMAAGGLAGGLGGGFGQQVTNQYNALQQLQSPANINAANSLGNSLFGRGMLGSSSGGILSQQFGQGLAQQSSADAAAASQLGIQALGTQANAATGLTWMGSNALNSAFSNFGNTSMLAPNVQSSYLNPALAGITGAGNLTNTGLGLYNAGLQSTLGQNQAAARAGYLGTTNANSQNQQSPYGQLLGNLFGGLAQGNGGAGGLGGIANQLQQLFGGGNNLSSYLGSIPSITGMNSGLLAGFGDNGAGAAANDILGNYSMGSDLSSIFGPSAAGGEAAGLAPAGAGVNGSMLMPSMLPGSYGSTATLGTGFDTTGLDAINGIGYADPTASAAAGGAPTLGAAPGALAGGALMGGMLAVAAHQNPTALSGAYWNNLNSTLANGPGSGTPNYGGNNALAPIAQNTQYQGALADLANTFANQGNGNSTIPNSELQTLAGYGITPASLSNYNSTWAQAAANMPSLMAQNDMYGIPNYSTPSRQGL